MVKIAFDFFAVETLAAFGTLSEHFKLVEAQMHAARQLERDRILQIPVPTDDEKYEIEYRLMKESYNHRFNYQIPLLNSYSFTLMLYLELEFRVNGLCSEINKRENVILKISDLRGSLFERFIKFLKLVGKPPVLRPETQFFRDLSAVRHCIAHNNGYLDGYRRSSEIKDIENRQLGISVIQEYGKDRMIISSQYFINACESSHRIFTRLFRELNFG